MAASRAGKRSSASHPRSMSNGVPTRSTSTTALVTSQVNDKKQALLNRTASVRAVDAAASSSSSSSETKNPPKPHKHTAKNIPRTSEYSYQHQQDPVKSPIETLVECINQLTSELDGKVDDVDFSSVKRKRNRINKLLADWAQSGPTTTADIVQRKQEIEAQITRLEQQADEAQKNHDSAVEEAEDKVDADNQHLLADERIETNQQLGQIAAATGVEAAAAIDNAKVDAEQEIDEQRGCCARLFCCCFSRKPQVKALQQELGSLGAQYQEIRSADPTKSTESKIVEETKKRSQAESTLEKLRTERPAFDYNKLDDLREELARVNYILRTGADYAAHLVSADILLAFVRLYETLVLLRDKAKTNGEHNKSEQTALIHHPKDILDKYIAPSGGALSLLLKKFFCIDPTNAEQTTTFAELDDEFKRLAAEEKVALLAGSKFDDLKKRLFHVDATAGQVSTNTSKPRR